MADKRASLILELKDMASAGLGKAKSAIEGLRASMIGAGAALTALIGFLSKALNEYGQQEAAVAKLNQALENQGIKSEAVTNDLIAYAEQLQRTSTIADDVALGAMALGVTFGLTGDALKSTTQAAADMSAALGIDLKTTMLLLGKASVGETSTLSRYGIIISENVPKAERFAAALEQVNSRFGGAAAAQTETYNGKMALLKNTFGDLFEEVGAFVAGPAKMYISWLIDGINWGIKRIKVDDEILKGYQKVTEQLKKEKEEIAGVQAMRDRWGDTDTAEFKNAQEQIRIRDARIKLIEKETQAYIEQTKAKGAQVKGPAAEEEDKELAKLMEKAQAKIDAATFTNDELEAIDIDYMARELERKGQHDLALELRASQQTLKEKKQLDDRAKNWNTSLNTIATMSNSHNKSLAAIGKAAAISTATIDTFVGVGKAWSLGPIVGPPMAALVAAAGMANVAQIAGVKLAEGGMIMPSSGGTMATMAEAGRPEVAIPLDDDRTKDKLRDVFGGGSTIVINAGAVIADEYSLNEFVEKIDEKLYERQRNKRSYT